MLETLMLPHEVSKVFDTMKDLFNALPFPVKLVLVGIFAVACLFSVMKMLT